MVSSEAIKPPRGGDNGLLAIGRRNSSSSHIAIAPAAAVPAASASHATGSSRDKTLPREERREIRKFKHESRRVNETSRSLMNLMSDQLDRDQKQNELLRAQLDQLKLSQGAHTRSVLVHWPVSHAARSSRGDKQGSPRRAASRGAHKACQHGCGAAGDRG